VRVATETRKETVHRRCRGILLRGKGVRSSFGLAIAEADSWASVFPLMDGHAIGLGAQKEGQLWERQ
jgi:hypothetical protein